MIISEESVSRIIMTDGSFWKAFYYYYLFIYFISKCWRHFSGMTNMTIKSNAYYTSHTPCWNTLRSKQVYHVKIWTSQVLISVYTGKSDKLNSLCVFAADLGMINSTAQYGNQLVFFDPQVISGSEIMNMHIVFFLFFLEVVGGGVLGGGWGAAVVVVLFFYDCWWQLIWYLITLCVWGWGWGLGAAVVVVFVFYDYWWQLTWYLITFGKQCKLYFCSIWSGSPLLQIVSHFSLGIHMYLNHIAT